MFIGLFGFPGAGKGTQAERMAKHWSIPHISTGDMFREIQKGQSELAGEIRAILAAGRLVSDDMVTRLTFERLAQPDCKPGFILDGYPRTRVQAEDLQNSPFALTMLISVDVDRQEIIRRLSERRVCPTCRSVFSLSALPAGENTICPHDATALVERPDDSVDAITTRLSIFEQNFRPVMEFFAAKKLLHHVNGMGDADVVFSRLVELVNQICQKHGNDN